MIRVGSSSSASRSSRHSRVRCCGRYDPSAQELARRLEAPSLAHPLGLDELGRDILARLLQGARISLMVGIAVVSVSSTVGMLFGSIAGYFGGWIDDVISRVIDVLMAFPGILLAIALVAVLGPSLVNVVLALSIIGWVGYARLVRGQSLRAREFEFVQAARASGAGRRADRRAPHPTDGDSRRRRPGHAWHGWRDHRRSGIELPRSGRAATDPKLGDDAGCGTRASVRRASPDDLSGAGDRGAGAGVQLPWGWAPGPRGSEDGTLRQLHAAGERERVPVRTDPFRAPSEASRSPSRGIPPGVAPVPS